jgi:heavy metal sensor kinase
MRWWRRRSIRTRLTLWYAAVLLLLLGGFSGAVFVALERALSRNLDSNVEQRAEALLATLEPQGNLVLPGSGPGADDDDDEGQDEEPWARTWDLGGSVVSAIGASSELPAFRDDVFGAIRDDDETWRNVTLDGDPYRMLFVPIERDGDIIGVLEIGQSREEQVEALGALRRILLFGVPIAVAATGVGGFLLALRALRPIDRITRKARSISAEALDQRLDMDLPDDELGRLARTFDDMLARLDTEFRRQRQFTADASHELRTPLAALKGHVDVALSRPRDIDEYRRVLDRVNVEVDRLIGLVQSLLVLARADAGEVVLRKERIDVGELLEAAAEQVEPLASERGLTLAASGEQRLLVDADESLLLQLVLNLIDNALKYTPSGGSISITWAKDGAHVRIAVVDTGPGIEAEHLARVFDRFYRIDKARSRGDGSSGLGLSIAKWIAEAHGGSISAVSEPGKGTAFTVLLPLASLIPV